jgi:predicted RNA-binding Zn-ribbon protein involved in translation (DUF1610 family)
MSKSRPVYQKPRLDPAGRAHLIVSDQAALPDDAFEDDLAFSNIETWVVAVAAPGIQAPETGGVRAFRAVADLATHLRHRLSRETAGFRLYALGTEGFLWDVMNLARLYGLGEGEVRLCQAGSLRRRVYCTHCKTMIETVTTNIVGCPACGAKLFVRDHFSRRLAAFMGVAVDAEAPGEIPEIEVIYP